MGDEIVKIFYGGVKLEEEEDEAASQEIRSEKEGLELDRAKGESYNSLK